MKFTFVILTLVVVGVPALIYLLWYVHCALDRVCVGHARRFCKRQGLEICRARCQPAFEQSGIKTESTLVQLDCFDAQRQRRLILLLVWPFGVRRLVSDETYPESYDSEWPVVQTTNYATKISLVMPFAAAVAGVFTAIGSHSGILVCIISAFGGFVFGFCMGALSVGFSSLLLHPRRGGSALVLFGVIAAYFLVPLIFLTASCLGTVIGLRWIL